MSESEDVGVRVAKEMEAIFDELPGRLNIMGILQDAHARLVAAATAANAPAPVSALIVDKVVEVLREIATQAVGEFTRRTGQPFMWVDEPTFEEPAEPLMSFALDAKGNVIF